MGFSAIFQCTYGVHWSNLISSFPLPLQLPAITILPDFGNLIASSVHSDTPVQHVRDVKSEVLTPDFQRCIIIHRHPPPPQRVNLYLLPDWPRASLRLATTIPPFLAVHFLLVLSRKKAWESTAKPSSPWSEHRKRLLWTRGVVAGLAQTLFILCVNSRETVSRGVS